MLNIEKGSRHHFSYEKLIQSLNFFASNTTSKKIMILKANYLFSIANILHMRQWGRPLGYFKFLITEDYVDCLDVNALFANRRGSVVNGFMVQIILRSIDDSTVYKSLTDFDSDYFSKSEIEILESTQLLFGKYEIKDFIQLFQNQARVFNDEKRIFYSEKDIELVELFFSSFSHVSFIMDEEILKFNKEYALEQLFLNDIKK